MVDAPSPQSSQNDLRRYGSAIENESGIQSSIIDLQSAQPILVAIFEKGGGGEKGMTRRYTFF